MESGGFSPEWLFPDSEWIPRVRFVIDDIDVLDRIWLKTCHSENKSLDKVR